jgi:hypothetical protein
MNTEEFHTLLASSGLTVHRIKAPIDHANGKSITAVSRMVETPQHFVDAMLAEGFKTVYLLLFFTCQTEVTGELKTLYVFRGQYE